MNTKYHIVEFPCEGQANLVEKEHDATPLGAKEIFAKTLYSLISPGTELAVYQGHWIYGAKAFYPFPPGYATVHEVVETGAEVTKFKKGDIVFSTKFHMSSVRGQESDFVIVPSGLAADKALFARIMSISWTSVYSTTARPPAKVIVTGLGPVGLMAAQLLKRCGYQVYGCDPVAARREAAQKCGISRVIEKIPFDQPEFAQQIAAVFECSGHEKAALDAVRVVRKHGEVFLIGLAWSRKTDIYAQELLQWILFNYVSVRGGWEWAMPMHPAESGQNSIMGNFETGLEWLADGSIKVDGLYSLVEPKDCQDVYQNLLNQKGGQLLNIYDWTNFLNPQQ